MRKTMFWLGWTIILLLPIAFMIDVAIDPYGTPSFPLWKFAIPAVGVVLILLGRNRDDVLKHRVA